LSSKNSYFSIIPGAGVKKSTDYGKIKGNEKSTSFTEETVFA